MMVLMQVFARDLCDSVWDSPTYPIASSHSAMSGTQEACASWDFHLFLSQECL